MLCFALNVCSATMILKIDYLFDGNVDSGGKFLYLLYFVWQPVLHHILGDAPKGNYLL